MNNGYETRYGRAGGYSCGHRTGGYSDAVCALADTKVGTYRTSSIPMADFWRLENLSEIGKIIQRRIPGINLGSADKIFECPTEPVLDGKVVGDASMTDLMIRDGR